MQTWLEEFCPVPAEKFRNKTWLQVAERDLRKWVGLRTKNLEKHGLEKDYIRLFGGKGGYFFVGKNTCAFCQRAEKAKGGCRNCPLTIARGNDLTCCETVDGTHLDPYTAFTDKDDPEPMIHLIRKAKKMLEDK